MLPTLLVVLVGDIGPSISAQDLTVLPARPATPVYLHNARLHTVEDGDIEGGALLLRDGKIEAVWRADDERHIDAASTIIVDLQGKDVWPGLISPWTALGLSEIASLPDTIDLDEVGDTNPELYASVAVNPDATAIPVTRQNGVLTAGVAPRGGLVPGHLSVMSLAGWTSAEMTVRSDAGLVVEWPSDGAAGGLGRRVRAPVADPAAPPRNANQTPAPRRETARIDRAGDRRALRAREARLDDLIAQARGYASARAADPELPIDVRFDGMLQVLSGLTPVFVRAASRDQIERAVDWGQRHELRLVLVGAESAMECADLLRARDIPLILASPHRLPSRRDADYDEAFALPAKVHAAGLRWCLAHELGGFANERNLPYAAGTAIAYGLDRGAALRAMTLSTAEILGVADRLGSLRVGKDATLFVTRGEPWELDSEIEDVWIGGRRIERTSKQTELARKYREKYRQLDRK
ncbi:MAG: amidohydrolase family protein [Planctomycetota bacterium]